MSVKTYLFYWASLAIWATLQAKLTDNQTSDISRYPTGFQTPLDNPNGSQVPKLNRSENIMICMPGSVLKLTAETYSPTIKNGIYFIEFHSPSCMFCHRLAPTWMKLAEKMGDIKQLCIAEYDCEAEMIVCSTLKIKRVPTIIWFENGAYIREYNGYHSLNSLSQFAQEMLGLIPTKRIAKSITTINKPRILCCIIVVLVIFNNNL